MQLAVMLRSCADHYGGTLNLDVFVADGGLSRVQRSKISKTLDGTKLRLHWTTPTQLPSAKLFLSNHITVSTYYRLLLDGLIPEHVKRVVYIDADTLVLGDVNQLLDCSVDGNVLLARKQSAPNGWSFSNTDHYFNAGVLVIDCKRWRDQKVGTKSIEFSIRHGKRNTEWDQGALNAVLENQWGELDGQWNCEPKPLSKDDRPDQMPRAGILHYLGTGKPWHSDYPYAEIQAQYFQWIDKTQWRGWRPGAGIESAIRRYAASPWISRQLKQTQKFRARFGLNYATLYRFFRDR